MTYMWRIQLLCFFALLIASVTSVASISEKKAQDELVFGVLPFLSPVAMIKRFSPLKDYMEEITGKKVFLESAPTFPEYLKRTISHEYDVVYTAPHFVSLSLKDGYYQLLASTEKIAAHVMVKNSSSIHTTQQLAGKRIAQGPNEAFVVIVAKYLLKTKGLRGKKAPKFMQYKSHNAALRAIYSNEVDAAIVGSFLLSEAKDSGLRQIAKTDTYPGIGILVPKTMSQEMKQKIKSAFLKIKNTKQGRETLKMIKFPGYEQVSPAAYKKLIPVAEDAYKMSSFKILGVK